VRRVADFLFRNWPLKLAAILLATVLYSGLVLGQNVRAWSGTLPVDPIRPPAGATLLADPDPVTQVRYRAPLDVGVVSSSSFSASVDLSSVDVQPGGQPQTVPVTVVALDPRIQVVDFQPRDVQISLDPVATRDVAVDVSMTAVPEGLRVGPPQTEPSMVTIRGASSRVDAVTSVVARVAIDASALNIDREVELIAVDSNGTQVPNVEIDPTRARVRIAVARQLANRTLPVVPIITGQPAPGYRITSVTLEPLTVTVSGEEATVSQLETADTEPIDITGRNRDVEASVRIALPAGASVAGSDTVRVIVTLGEDTGTRTFQVGVELVGEVSGVSYLLGQPTANVTLGGPITALDAVDASQLTAQADVATLPDSLGPHVVALEVTPPESLDVVSIDPDTVVINLTTVEASFTSVLAP
jgi:YbbR domain-containing protein